MPDERPADDDGFARSAALAAELRAIVQAVTDRELSDETLERATALARELRETLGGERRTRWYEAQGANQASPGSRRSYLAQSPVRGRLNPLAPPLEVVHRSRDDGSSAVEGRARLGSAYEGPPHGVHGGFVAALFDDLLGSTQSLTPGTGVTARLTVRYRHITPLDEELRFTGWIHEERGRRVVARATCHAGDLLTANAEGLFVHVDFDEVREAMRRRKPRTPD